MLYPKNCRSSKPPPYIIIIVYGALHRKGCMKDWSFNGKQCANYKRIKSSNAIPMLDATHGFNFYDWTTLHRPTNTSFWKGISVAVRSDNTAQMEDQPRVGRSGRGSQCWIRHGLKFVRLVNTAQICLLELNIAFVGLKRDKCCSTIGLQF